MRTSVISFDPNIAEMFTNKLGEGNVRVYIDSISMLKEIEDFKPNFIVYDASAGDFAFDDLKFLISRDKVKDKNFKVLYSSENPINQDELEAKNIMFYEKSSEAEKAVLDILDESKDIEISTTEPLHIEQPQEELQEPQIDEFTTNELENLENFENQFTNPQDMEELYFQEQTQESQEEEHNFDFTDMSIEDLEEVNTTFEELSDQINKEENLNNKIEEKPNEDVLKQEFTNNIDNPVEPQPPTNNVLNDTNSINLSLPKDEIKDAIVKYAVDKLVSQLKEEPEIKELFFTIEKDFIERINQELEDLKQQLKEEIKENVLKKVEEDILKDMQQNLKEYITNITAEVVKEKISQIFAK